MLGSGWRGLVGIEDDGSVCPLTVFYDFTASHVDNDFSVVVLSTHLVLDDDLVLSWLDEARK